MARTVSSLSQHYHVSERNVREGGHASPSFRVVVNAAYFASSSRLLPIRLVALIPYLNRKRKVDEAELLEAMLDGSTDKDSATPDAAKPANRGVALVRVQQTPLRAAASSANALVAETVFESSGFAALLAEFRAPPTVAALAALPAAGADPGGSAYEAAVWLAHPSAAARALRVETTVTNEPAEAPTHRTAVFLAFATP